MQAFAYGKASDIVEALAEASAPDTVFLAGGTELLNWLRLGIVKPARVIDIGRLEGLTGVSRLPDGGLHIGALTRLNDVALDDDVARDYPVLSEAILQSASAQLRNLATVGGNPLQKTRCGYFRSEAILPCNKRWPGSGCSALHGFNDKHAIFGWSQACVATQPSDPANALAALDAVYVTDHRDGSRRIKAEDLHRLPGETPHIENTLRDGELIVGIELPGPAPHSAYLKLRERQSYEYAVVSAAVALDLQGDSIRRASIALGGVAHKPWRLVEAELALAGIVLGDAPAIRKALDTSFATARPLTHNAYKVPLAKNAAERAIRLAAARGS
ncbi:FAD binding domain-containing protein [Mesorhizobium sp. B1-1-8]|uniref:FAD binding domain-containing protein n=1 Tax=Mesorhizobium sp. B1-1-8 TaxID=2589976 RepID=UPI0011260C53|nr:xanthine dehydrogenase family protein subunit M [Mesorhizobium sp. B1-1-8]UCI05174.1 xanthine dehydrogenase family protein subunit M [Mesorhizobium sp. B1-1-8]